MIRVVAVDGPSGSGKSTVSRAVADFLRGQPVEPGVRLGQDGGH